MFHVTCHRYRKHSLTRLLQCNVLSNGFNPRATSYGILLSQGKINDLLRIASSCWARQTAIATLAGVVLSLATSTVRSASRGEVRVVRQPNSTAPGNPVEYCLTENNAISLLRHSLQVIDSNQHAARFLLPFLLALPRKTQARINPQKHKRLPQLWTCSLHSSS